MLQPILRQTENMPVDETVKVMLREVILGLGRAKQNL